MRQPTANKQLLYVAAHLRHYCQKQESRRFRAVDFIDYLAASPDVHVGFERSTLPKDSLVFVHKTPQEKRKIIRARSSGFFNGLWLHRFVLCVDVEGWSKRLESKCFDYNEDPSVWRHVPLLRFTEPQTAKDHIADRDKQQEKEVTVVLSIFLDAKKTSISTRIKQIKNDDLFFEFNTWCAPHSFFRSEAVKKLSTFRAMTHSEEVIAECRKAAKQARVTDMREYHPDKWVQRSIKLESQQIFTRLKEGHENVARILRETNTSILLTLKCAVLQYDMRGAMETRALSTNSGQE